MTDAPDARGRLAGPPSGSAGEACPGEEMVAAYAEGRLGDEQQAHVAEHVSRCEDCYTLVREVTLALAQVDDGASGGPTPAAPAPDTPPFSAPRPANEARRPPRGDGARRVLLPLAATLLVSAGGAYLAWQQGLFLTSPTVRLARAVGERRFIEPRLSGGFRFGPTVDVKRSGEAGHDDDLDIAAAEARKRARARPTLDNRRAAAAADLLQGRADGAIRALELLAAEQPASAEGWSDLAAAYLVRAQRDDVADDWPRALDAARRALALRPGFEEAAYNKGLALERLGPRSGAIAHWETFLAEHPRSAWADEVRARLDGLRRAAMAAAAPDFARLLDDSDDGTLSRAVAAAPSAARAFFERHLLVAWADAVLAGRDAQPALARAARVADAFGRATHDGSLRRTLAALVTAREPAALAAAHRDYAAGLALDSQAALAEASRRFEAAAPALRAAGSPYARWVDYQRGVYLYRSRPADAAPALAACEAAARRAGDTTLAAYAATMRGVLAVGSHDRDAARARYGDAASLFKALGDRAQSASVAVRQATVARLSGNTRAAWAMELRALDLGAGEAEPRQAFTALLGLAVLAQEGGLTFAAAEFAHAARQATRAAAPDVRAVALIQTAGLAGPEGGWSRAAEGLLGELRDDALRRRLRFELDAARLDDAALTPDDAVDAANGALDAMPTLGMQGRRPELLLGRARALRRAGKTDDAERDLATVLVALSDVARGASPLDRHAADLAWPAAQELTRLRLDEARPEEALAVLETARADGGGPVAWETAPALLGERAGVIAFETFADETVCWRWAGGDLTARRVPLGRDTVRLLVGHTLGEIEAERGAADAARVLAQGLLAPALDAWPPQRHVYVVASGDLARLPWPALLRLAGAEGLTLSQLPGLAWLARERTRERASHGLLLVGAHGSDPAARLVAVADELRTLARTHDATTLLLDDDAEPARVLAALGRAAIVHVAAHAVAAGDPRRAFIDLGTPRHPERRLTAIDLSQADLSPVGLVVLAVCSGAEGATRRSAVPHSLGALLLHAGAGAVIASVARVRDGDAAAFSRVLHARLARGETVPAAFRDALADLRADPARAAMVDAWVLLGADAGA